MRIDEVKLHLYAKRDSKLYLVKMVNYIRGGGLKHSKEIVDELFINYNSDELIKEDINDDIGDKVIAALRKEPDWKVIKSNIRKLKTL